MKHGSTPQKFWSLFHNIQYKHLINESLTLKAKLLFSVNIQLISREMPETIHCCVRNMPQRYEVSLSQDCFSQVLHGLSFTRSTEWHPTWLEIKGEHCFGSAKSTWCWGARVGLSVGTATLKRRPLGMQMHNLYWPTSPWSKTEDCQPEMGLLTE